MSLAEIEKQVRELPAAERFQFISWVYAHENELIESPAEAMAPDLMEELLRRRRELEEGTVQTFTIEEATARVREALDEVHRSRH
ncbi:MAG: hypothetical protein P4L99_00440 [Chthoniobacter sp.]|nr:hypothetical protein [Chthoniobacter sp.]